MTLLLVRHGQSLANERNHSDHRSPVQVADESPLSTLGQLQTHRLGRSLSASIDPANPPLIFSSPLGRARHTATILRDYFPGAPILVHEGLQEVAVADNGIVAGVRAAREGLAEIISDVKIDIQNVRLLVAHEWILQLLLQSLLGCIDCDVWFRLANCSITRFEVDRCVRNDGRFRDGLSLVSLNDVSHLQSDQITY